MTNLYSIQKILAQFNCYQALSLPQKSLVWEFFRGGITSFRAVFYAWPLILLFIYLFFVEEDFNKQSKNRKKKKIKKPGVLGSPSLIEGKAEAEEDKEEEGDLEEGEGGVGAKERLREKRGLRAEEGRGEVAREAPTTGELVRGDDGKDVVKLLLVSFLGSSFLGSSFLGSFFGSSFGSSFFGSLVLSWSIIVSSSVEKNKKGIRNYRSCFLLPIFLPSFLDKPSLSSSYAPSLSSSLSSLATLFI